MKVICNTKIFKQACELLRDFQHRNVSSYSQSKAMPYCYNMPNFTEMKEDMSGDIEDLGSNHNNFSCKINAEDHMIENTVDMDLLKMFYRKTNIGKEIGTTL